MTQSTTMKREWVNGVYQYLDNTPVYPDRRCKCRCYNCVFSTNHCSQIGKSGLCKVKVPSYAYYKALEDGLPIKEETCHCICNLCSRPNLFTFAYDHCGNVNNRCYVTPRALAHLDEYDDDGASRFDFENEKWCCVGDSYCVYVEKVYSRCKACGIRACEYCSVRTRKVPKLGRARICHFCLREYGQDDVVDEHLDLLSEIFGINYHDYELEDDLIEDLHITREDIL